MMNEEVLAVGLFDETKALLVIKPFNFTFTSQMYIPPAYERMISHIDIRQC
jgi:hypothetical protein